jgi:hypothetical protein
VSAPVPLKSLVSNVPLGAAANISVRVGSMYCWSCGAQTQIVTGVDVVFGPDRYEFSVPRLGRYAKLFDIIRPEIPATLEIGVIKHRFSNTQQRQYLSNGCAHCDALLGEFYEHEAWVDQKTVCTFSVRIDEEWRRAIDEQVE